MFEIFDYPRTDEYKKYLVWTFTEPPTIQPFWFEKIDLVDRIQWSLKYWTISIYASILYLILIAYGQYWMRNRKPFGLKKPLIAWNFALAVFSTWGFARTVPELYQILSSPNGFHRSVCVREIFNESSGFYGYWFLWSKVFELGDTAFIILRKKPLIFLHWFHHLTVLVAAWLTAFHFDPVGRWFGVVNMGVHSMMYTYYTLRAAGYRVPQPISITITSFQIGQMAFAVGLNFYAIYMLTTGTECARSKEGIKIHFAMYFSYLVLFAHYFYNAYLRPKKNKSE